MFELLGNTDYALEKIKSYTSRSGKSDQGLMQRVSSPGLPFTGYARSGIVQTAISKQAQSNVIFTQPQFYSPIHTPQNWQVPAKRREVYQYCRYFADQEPKVAAALDFYSKFPMNGFQLQCPDFKIRQYFENLCKKWDIDTWCRHISKEYYTIGDVFPFLEVSCPQCQGSGVNRDKRSCNHPEGSFSRIVVLNPDWIDVQTTVLAKDPVITLLPDEELKRVVWLKQPRELYDRLPAHIKSLITAGRPIPLANESVSHLKFNPYPYGVYGTSIIKRLFKVLMYKDKLMTAQWIVAERLILPIRVVKVGDSERPATATDIADVQQQLAQVANDPNLTLVTHHAFDYDWIGTSGKVLQLSNEYDLINKEILQGLMINEALLSGDMAGYSSAAIGAEGLIRRMESWRLELSTWIEERVFKQVAQMKGLIDKEASEEIGEPIWKYPKIKWNDLNLRDQTQVKQTLIQLHDKGCLSTKTLLDKFDLDYDTEIEHLRLENATGMGQSQGGGGGGQGGGGGGGAPPGGVEMGGAGGAPGGAMPGAEMGGAGGPGAGGMDLGLAGAPGGGAPSGAPTASASNFGGSSGKILAGGKKGGDTKTLDEEQVQPRGIKLTTLEQTMYKIIEDLNLPFKKYMQANVIGYQADFAIPALKLDIECDGEKWHSEPEAVAHDKKRDMDLAKIGWTTVRFREKELKEKQAEVKNTVAELIQRLWAKAVERQQKQLTAGVSTSDDWKRVGVMVEPEETCQTDSQANP